MCHYSEDELILYHYGEGRRRERIDEHLQSCASCAEMSHQIAETMATVGELEVPERDDRYGLEVWQRIRHDLPVPDAPWWMAWYRVSAAGAMAALVVTAFIAGRFWSATPSEQSAPAQAIDLAVADPEGDDARVRMAAIGDHLEQSERVLLDLVNADGQRIDVTGQQAWASDLIEANRLYRQASERAGDEEIASVLDELERNLLEIVHGPSSLSLAELEAMRVRLDAAALVFKVRILADELRERELAPSQPRKTT